MKKLPTYKISIDDEYSEGEDLSWSKTAFTSKPAIKVKGIAFSADVDHKSMMFADSLRYRIAAPAIIPSTIYRNQDGEEFYVEFTEAEIEKIHQKFMKNLGRNKGLFNLEHDNSQTVPAYMLECWIVEQPEKDKSFSTFGVKVPKGSLFMVAQITDKEYYAKLVENDQIGFSIEGFFGLALSMSEQSENITETNTQVQMEDNKVILPEGEKFQIKDKWYIVKDGQVVEYVEAAKDVAAEAVAEVALAEETAGVELAEVPVVEETVVEPAPAEAPANDYYSKAEVDAKFEELYKLIASLQEEEKIEDEPAVEVMMSEKKSLQSGFAAMRRMLRD